MIIVALLFCIEHKKISYIIFSTSWVKFKKRSWVKDVGLKEKGVKLVKELSQKDWIARAEGSEWITALIISQTELCYWSLKSKHKLQEYKLK